MSGMYQKAPTNGARRPLRRSTRLRQAVAFTVTGVDAYRGPYCEQVTAETFSCHGCRYKSKHDVPIDSEVMLELKSELPGEQAVFARGVVSIIQLGELLALLVALLFWGGGVTRPARSTGRRRAKSLSARAPTAEHVALVFAAERCAMRAVTKAKPKSPY